MDKDFIETYKLLKKHYSRVVGSDVNTQSNDELFEPDISKEIISEARELLLYEQLYALSDKDIENLRQNSVAKYAKTLENFINPKCSKYRYNCSKNRIAWTVEIFDSDSTKTGQNNIQNSEKTFTDKLELPQSVKNKHQVKEYIDNILKVNIDVNIDQILKKYSSNSNYIHFPSKIKQDIIKERQELAEVLKKQYKISDDDENNCVNNLNEICEVTEEWGEENEFIETTKTEVNEEEVDKKNSDIGEEMLMNVADKKCNISNSNKDSEDYEYINKKNEDAGSDMKVLKFSEIPELNVIAQSKTNVDDFLEISKIHLEGEENHWKSKTNREVLRKSFTKWRNLKKQELVVSNKKIESFLENFENYKTMTIKAKSDLEKAKSPQHVVKTKPKSSSLENKIVSFENRFKAQRNIIEAQKAKLIEQEKLIQDLKLNKIKLIAQESLKDARNEIRKTVPGLIKQKPLIKLDERSDSEDNKSLSTSLNLTKAPKIVQCMEERAREREERRMLTKERKRLIEEEKKRVTEEAIQRKMKEEAIEKQKRLEKLKEQRKIAREFEIKRQMEKKHFIEINEKAFAHYKKKIVQTCFNKIKMLIINMRIQVEIAIRFYDNYIVQKQFKKLRKFTETEISNRNNIVDNFYRNTLQGKCFNAFKLIYFKRRRNEQVAQDRYDMSLQTKFFKEWHALVCQLHIQNRINLSKADKKYSRNLMFQCFLSWRKLPAIMEIERIQNERKRIWRIRVAEILPDYDPMKDSD